MKNISSQKVLFSQEGKVCVVRLSVCASALLSSVCDKSLIPQTTVPLYQCTTLSVIKSLIPQTRQQSSRLAALFQIQIQIQKQIQIQIEKTDTNTNVDELLMNSQ